MEDSLVLPVRNPPALFRENVATLRDYFVDMGIVRFEIVLVPNSAKQDLSDVARSLCAELEVRYPEVRSVVHGGAPGKGAAITTGVNAARGEYILFTDADLPYHLEFFPRALELLKSGYVLVAGNRRRAESWFEIPVPLLPYVYSRHRKSLFFNWAVRRLLPITVTDTQAGIKAMTRELARHAFCHDLCPGFFFDIELFLIADSLGLKYADLPVRFTQYDDATTVGFFLQSVRAINWLIRIKMRHLLGYYRRPMKVVSPLQGGEALNIP